MMSVATGTLNCFFPVLLPYMCIVDLRNWLCLFVCQSQTNQHHNNRSPLTFLFYKQRVFNIHSTPGCEVVKDAKPEEAMDFFSVLEQVSQE